MVGYVASPGEPAARPRRQKLAVALSFYLAVLLTFAVLGVAAAMLGELLSRWERVFAGISAAISLIAGLVVILRPHMPARVPQPRRHAAGPAGAFLFGVIYSIAVVTTSTGPLLLLLAGAAAVGDPIFGALLSVAYAIGRGFPFVLLGIFGDAIARWAARFARYARGAELMIGIGLIGLAVYLGWTAIRPQ